MTDDELKALVVSNARSIQAMSESMETSRLRAEDERKELRETMDRLARMVGRAEGERQELRETMDRLAKMVGGVVNLTVSLDSDRPTVLSKLDSIENGVKRIEKRLEGESE